jgi:hypothetical protein
MMTFKSVSCIHSPDPAAVDCESVLEALGRLERLALKLKAAACRGDEHAARLLDELVDETYDLFVNTSEAMK